MAHMIGERPQTDQPGPPRRASTIVVAVLVIGALLFILDRTSFEDERDTRTVESPSTTVAPPEANGPGQRTLSGRTLIDAEAFAQGPKITWSEQPLPPDVTAVYAVGEFDGRPALLGTSEPADVRGLHPGVSFFLGDDDGGWQDSTWTLPSTEQVVTADIDRAGVIVVTAARGAARLPYTATDVTIFASTDGVDWTATRIAEASERWLVSLDATVGPPGKPSWVTGLTVVDDFPEVTAALPPSIRELVISGSASAALNDGTVVVSLPMGFPIFEATLAEMGLPADTTYSGQRRESLAWRSTDGRTFELTDNPAQPSLVMSMIRGADDRVLVLDTSSRILESRPDEAFEQVATLSNLGFGAAYLQSVAEKVVGVDGHHVEVLPSGSGRIMLAPPEGRGVSPYVPPAGGPAGLAVLTAAGGPEYTVTLTPAEISRAGVTVQVEPSEGWIRLIDDGTVVDEFRSPEDDERISFDPESSRLSLGAPPGETDVWITIDEMERAYMAGLSPNFRGPYGVAFTTDTETWGWAPVQVEAGRPLGPVAQLAVGENRVYAVLDAPQLPNNPRAVTGFEPRLLVGMISD